MTLKRNNSTTLTRPVGCECINNGVSIMEDKRYSCPNCGAQWPMYSLHYDDASKKLDESHAYMFCLQCDYQSELFEIESESTPSSMPKVTLRRASSLSPKVKEEKITFTAQGGGVDITIKADRDKLSKFLSIFADGN